MPKKSQQNVTLVAHDLNAALAGRKAESTHELAAFNAGGVSVESIGKGVSGWRRNFEDDVFLQVLEGVVEIELLTDSDSETRRLESGEFVVIPMGLWHRKIVSKSVKLLYISPGVPDKSNAVDPRNGIKMNDGGTKRGAAAKAAATATKSRGGQALESAPAAAPGGEKTGKSAAGSNQGRARTSSKGAKSGAGAGAKSLADEIRAYALTFPESHEDMPWGHPAFKVKNKMFVTMSFGEHGIKVTVKLTRSRLAASALPFVESTGYGLGEHGWVSINLDKDEPGLSMDTLKKWIEESFANVAPKSILKEYDKALVEQPVSKPKRAYNK